MDCLSSLALVCVGVDGVQTGMWLLFSWAVLLLSNTSARRAMKQCAAGVALMLISWARGGSLFSRGRGYNVTLHLLTPVNS